MHDERAREADALAHAARELARIRGLEAVEADQVDRRERALADLRARHAAAPRARAPRSRSTVSHGNSAKLWNTIAIPSGGPSIGSPRYASASGARLRQARRSAAAAWTCRTPSVRAGRRSRPRACEGSRRRARAARRRRARKRLADVVDVCSRRYGVHRASLSRAGTCARRSRTTASRSTRLITTTNRHIVAMPSTMRCRSPAAVASAMYAPRPCASSFMSPQLATSATIAAFHEPPEAVITPGHVVGENAGQRDLAPPEPAADLQVLRRVAQLVRHRASRRRSR